MSRVVSYRLELDAQKHPVLVAEKESEYIEKVDTPKKVVGLCNQLFQMEKLAEEVVCVVALNNSAKVLGIFKVFHGTNNISFCRPREIFIRALLAGATGICVVHNHTSGEVIPSEEDLQCTEQLEKMGDVIGIKLYDFIIIGNGCYYSAKEDGVIQ